MSIQIFLENQKVLCYHGDFLYGAKIIKVGTDPFPELKYLVHYNGWNKTWDEWVSNSRLMPLTEDNLLKQGQLIKDYDHKQRIVDKSKLRKKKQHVSSSTDVDLKVNPFLSNFSNLPSSPIIGTESLVETPLLTINRDTNVSSKLISGRSIKRTFRQNQRLQDSGSISANKKARRLRYVTVSEETYSQKCFVAVNIPTELKLSLIDDHDLINQQQFLISVPKRITVEDILKRYLNSRLLKGPNFQMGQVEIFCMGIQEYFDISLGMELLYKFERPQYVQLLSQFPTLTMSSVYGIEHLLRLFVKLSDLLGYTKFDGGSINVLELQISQFLSYLEQNLSLFQGDYTPVTQEYLRMMTYS